MKIRLTNIPRASVVDMVEYKALPEETRQLIARVWTSTMPQWVSTDTKVPHWLSGYVTS